MNRRGQMLWQTATIGALCLLLVSVGCSYHRYERFGGETPTLIVKQGQVVECVPVERIDYSYAISVFQKMDRRFFLVESDYLGSVGIAGDMGSRIVNRTTPNRSSQGENAESEQIGEIVAAGNAEQVIAVARSFRPNEKPKRGENWPINEAIVALHREDCACAAAYAQFTRPMAFVIGVEPTVLAILDLQSIEDPERERLEDIAWEDTRDGALRSFSFDVEVAVKVSNHGGQLERWYRGQLMFVNQSVASVEASHLFVHDPTSTPDPCGQWITLPAPTTLANLIETKPWLSLAP